MEKEKIEENVIPLFLVSNVVLFPKVRVPLVVSEERYKSLIFDSIAKSSFIGVFPTSRIGVRSEDIDKIYPVGCAGKIVSVSEVSPNVFSIVVEGLFRVKLLSLLKGEVYNNVRFEILHDILPDEKTQQELKRDLIETAVRFLIKIGESKERIVEISQIANNMNFEEVLNWAIFLHPLRFASKLSLMSENDVKVRAKRFVEEVKRDIFYMDLIAEYRDIKPKDPRVN
ncbi:MAG: LON peptidase substrate-binding domain-containing protein [Candidatus Calescibacterium sp.]|nr:LON peptidase substrate-binding domain-containing protein [Candidatus Calescibacterium sp.]MCX7734963.1 LON peptidase substrate-binding domain-containing protein [bacterium]MDW8088098.1 LON peptidase substrate-binding domain-containing protein [Candidatus Calescibacterium sp.]